MSAPGTLTAALNYLPCWWQETTETSTLDSLLLGWDRACGWQASGFVFQGGESAVVSTTVSGGQLKTQEPPVEVPDALRRLKAGESTVHYSLPNSTGRVFALVHPSGRKPGVLWAEKAAGQPWLEEERALLALSAGMLAKAPALTARIGSVIDSEKLYHRLGDAAVIAGRLAHDFDNLLQGIIGFSDLALPLVPASSQAAQFIHEIGKVGQRGIQFTQQLHHLSRSGQAKPMAGVVAQVLAREESRLMTSMPANVRIEKEFFSNLQPVAMEAGPLQIVLGHVLENAIEACPGGGVVRISAQPVELTAADARGYLGRVGVGGYLQINITDTGCGIKPEVRRRLFLEPFCTTKVRHRGLGLAIVYRVLYTHNGGIQVESVSSPGTGTNVRIVLPLASARPSAVVTEPIAATAARG